MRQIILLSILIFPGVTLSDSCIQALKMDQLKIGDTTKQRLAFLKTIDSDRWKEMKKTHNIDTNFLGFGMDINGDSDYSTLDKERTKVNKRFNYTFDLEHAYSYYSKSLSNNAKDAYISCKRIEASKEKGGVLIYAKKTTDSSVQVEFEFDPPSAVPFKGKLKIISLKPEGLNSAKEVQSVLDVLTRKGKQGYTLKRDKSQDLFITVNSVKGFLGTAQLLIAAEPKINEQRCLSQNEVKVYQKDDKHGNAPLNISPCLKHRSFTGVHPKIDAWYRIPIVKRGKISARLSETSSKNFWFQIRKGIGEPELVAPSTKEPNWLSGVQFLEYQVQEPGEYLIRPQPYEGKSHYYIDVRFNPE